MEVTTTTTAADKEEEEKLPVTSLPWKTRIALQVISVVTDACRRRNGSVNRTLFNLVNMRSSANPKAVNGVGSTDVTVDPTRNLWYRLFVPTTTETKKLPVVVFYHGGGFCFLSADTKAYDVVCRRFAREIPAVVVSVDYRLAPEHRYPAQFDDGFDVLSFLHANGGVLPENADVSRCFLAGDSAGANIAHHVALRAAQSSSQLKVIGLVSIQPFFGGEERTEAELTMTQLVTIERTDWLWKSFLPEELKENRDHPAVNVSGPRAADISKLDSFPKTVVFVGGLDALQDWQRRYYDWLKKAGKEVSLIEYPAMCHAFYIFPELPEAAQLFSQVAHFVSTTVAPNKLQSQ